MPRYNLITHQKLTPTRTRRLPMKKLILTAMAIVAMAFTFADMGYASPICNNDGSLAIIENAQPHTKEYIATKKIIDKYEQDIKKATTCEELNQAAEELLSGFLLLIFDDENQFEESEQLTEEESDELDAKLNQVNELKEKKAEQFGCEPNTEEDDVELVPTTEEWEEMIAEFEVLLSKMEQLKKQNLSKEENWTKFLEIVEDHLDLIENLDKANGSNLTEKQDLRLTEINNRIEVLATEMGLDKTEEEENE